MRPGLAPRSGARKRLVREAIIARNIRHPNVVAAHDVGQAEGQVYIVMELLQGKNLRWWLGEQTSRGADCSVPAATAIMLVILEWLDAAHAQNVVHRDPKPENVFLLSEPGDGAMKLKILDFGLARTYGPQASHGSLQAEAGRMSCRQLTRLSKEGLPTTLARGRNRS